MKTNYIIILLLILALLLIIKYISLSNSFKRAKIKIEESLSGIDVALTKRYDVLTKMIEVVKGYTKHEKEVIFSVINLRNNMNITEKETENKKMDENETKINALAEAYPNLKASENFKILQKSIIDVEDHLQAARRFYNSNVTIYNEMLETFPNMIVAKIKGLKREQYFQSTEAETSNVNIKL